MFDPLEGLVHAGLGQVLLSLGVAAIVSWLLFRTRAARDALTVCDQLYQQGLVARSQERHVDALILAARAHHALPHHSCLNLMAHSLEDLGHHEAARQHWLKARNSCGTERDLHEYLALFGYYNFRETASFLREGLFEEAFKKSDNAIVRHIPHRDALATADGVNYEEQLRALRMVSGFHHLHGTAAWEALRDDAEWIVTNGIDGRLKKLAATSLNVSLAKEEMSKLLLPLVTGKGVER